MTLASDWLAHHAHVSPDALAAVDIASDRRWTYEAFNHRADRVARAFFAEGVRAGDRVAVLSHNDSDVFEIQFACQKLGAIFLPLNWRLAVPELEFICNDATPTLLVYGIEFSDAAADVAKLSNINRYLSLA
ncbi:MAG: AMP-binding protein, partial [Pseudomonadota bacterium]